MEIEQTPRDIDVLKMFLKDIPGPYVELGVALGGSLKLARETTTQECYGIDIKDRIAPEVRAMNIHFILGDSVEVGKTWDKPIGALLIDGDHYVKPEPDFNTWEKHVMPGGLILIHDCWSNFPAVVELCRKVKESGNYHVLKEPIWGVSGADDTSIYVFRKK